MKIICFIISMLISTSLPFTCLAVSQQPEQSGLAGDVFLMTKSLDELIQLLKSQQSKADDFQKLQAAISYLSFRSRSIEMKQYELRFKKERRDGLESTITRIEADPDKWDKFDKSFQTKSPVTTSSDSRPSELRIKMLQDRLEDAETEIIALETEIQNAQDELATFESYVQERLMLFK